MTNFKIIVVIVLLFVFLTFMYREILAIKEDLTTKITTATTTFNDATVNMTNKLQANMINCVTKMKDISNDNLQQLRKISMLNRQQVTKISNHFTETDSIDIDDTQCLSAKRSAIFNAKEEASGGGTHLYMSESDENNTKDNKITYKSPNINTKISSKNVNNIDLVQQSIANIDVDEDEDEDVDVDVDEDEDEDDTYDSDNSEQQIEVNMNEIIENNIPLTSLYGGANALNTKKNVSNSNSNSDTDDNIDNAIDDSVGSEAEEISVDGINDGSHEDENIINKKTVLEGINDYNIHGLRQVAKDNGLPVTRKNENGEWKTYNKADLYELIKNHLTNKNANATS